jgi:hypothetical protein
MLNFPVLIKIIWVKICAINFSLLSLQHQKGIIKNKKMKEYVSKKRRKIENELLFYLRRYRFFASRFRDIRDFDAIIDEIIGQLKSDV